MVFEQTAVGEFLQKTLVCQAQTPIQDILDLFQSRSESATSPADSNIESVERSADLFQLIVVNELDQPISSIPLSQFIRLFGAEQSLAPSLSPQQPISEWVNLHRHPLECVPETYSLKQFWQYLQVFSQDISLSWAIVQEVTGKYLGLLDTPRLVQFLAHQTPLSVAIKFSSDLKSPLSPTLELANPSTSIGDSTDLTETLRDNSLSPELLLEISHELKSPLTSILSLSNVLNHQGHHNLSERQIEYVQLIHQNSQQLMSIVNNLLDLTQLQTHSQPEPNTNVDLDLLCDDAIAQAKRYYILSKGTSETASPSIQRYPTEPLGVLSANELKLRQILVHLLHNSLGLTNDQSTVELKIERWQGWVIFTIQDRGGCVPHLQQPLVFQIPQTWTDPNLEYLGKTGLGIILAQRLAEQIFGDITFVSSAEYGNSFSLYIPTNPTKRSPTNRCTQGLVLVIASDPQLIDQLNQHLTDRSYRTVIARTAPEIRSKINTLKPQAIIVQATLITSDWGILAMLRQTVGTQPIALIGNDTDCQQAQKIGAHEYLALTDLDHCLEQWLDKSVENFSASYLRTENAQGSKLNRAIPPHPNSSKSQKLTVLHLDDSLEQTENILSSKINQAFRAYHWRVVSITTLEEAELLVKIWEPNVVLYTADDSQPFLEITSDSPLAEYPFVILNPLVREIAHKRGDLQVLDGATLATAQHTSVLPEISFLVEVLSEITIEAE